MAGVVTSAALLAVLLAALAACGGDGVHVDGFAVASRDRAACRDLLRALPDGVADQSRRHDVTGSPYAAAWGDPAIVLRCGVGTPKGFDRFSRCQRADGVDWFVPESVIGDLGADAVMTTVGRSPAVLCHPRGGPPRRLAARRGPRPPPPPPPAAMVDLAPVIKAHTTRTTPCT